MKEAVLLFHAAIPCRDRESAETKARKLEAAAEKLGMHSIDIEVGEPYESASGEGDG